MLLNDAIQEFLLACSADGLREKTLIWYTSLLGRFAEKLNRESLQEVTTSEIRQYLVQLRQAKYSEDTVHGHTRALHRFWRWCAVEYDIPNPMRNIRYPKQPKPKGIKAIDIADVIKLLEACEDDPFGKRDKAIIAFLFDTGVRAEGICGLTMPLLNMEAKEAYVIEKGDKGRMVSFTDVTAELISRWLEVRQDSEFVFHNRFGEKLTTNGLLQMTNRLKRKARVTGRANPHAFRHGFAVEYMMNGGDIYILSRILGHESIELTAKVYGRLKSSYIQELHREHSPMLKIKMSSKSSDSDDI